MYDDHDEAVLNHLSGLFMGAIEARTSNRLDRAEDLLREIVRTEPRLPEPHLELGRMLLDSDRLDEAEVHTREALTHLQAAGPWVDEVPANVVEALAHAQLAEVLRRRADEDDVIFGEPASFQALVRDAQHHFQRAAELDPSDEYASYHAFFLGAGAGSTEPASPAGDDA